MILSAGQIEPQPRDPRVHTEAQSLSQPTTGFFFWLQPTVSLDQFALIGTKQAKLEAAPNRGAVSNDCIYPDGVC